MTVEPVAIVGAGAAGATLALLLAYYDIRTTVIEQRSDPRLHPAAHVINARAVAVLRLIAHVGRISDDEVVAGSMQRGDI